MPYELTKPRPPVVEDDTPYVAKLHNKMQEVWDTARLLISKGKERQKKYYDRKACPTDLRVGDKVLYYNKMAYKNKTAKLIKRWQCMYIIQHITDTTAAIQPFNEPDQAPFRVHLNLLKRYKGPLVRGPTSELSIELDSPATQDSGSEEIGTSAPEPDDPHSDVPFSEEDCQEADHPPTTDNEVHNDEGQIQMLHTVTTTKNKLVSKSLRATKLRKQKK